MLVRELFFSQCDTPSPVVLNQDCSLNAAISGTANVIGVNECVSSPCMNGGTCIDYLDSYQCTCASGFTDVNCDLSVSIWLILQEFNGLLNLQVYCILLKFKQ